MAPRPDPSIDPTVERGLRLVEAALATVPAQMATIRGLVAARRRGSRTDSESHRLTVRLHALLVRLRHDVGHRCADAEDAANDLELAAGTPTPAAASLRRRARRVRADLAAYTDVLASVLADERREDEARRAAHQRLLGYAVAALAGVAAMPLLVGELDAAAIQDALGRLPAPLDGMANVVDAFHPWLVFAAVLGAAAVVVFLAVVFVRAGIGHREPHTDPVAVVGRVLPALKAAAGATDDATDRAVAKALVQACDELATADRRGRAGDHEEAMDAFIIRTELGARRPAGLALPRCLTLLRYGTQNGVAGPWVDDHELAAAFRSAGAEPPVVQDASTAHEVLERAERALAQA